MTDQLTMDLFPGPDGPEILQGLVNGYGWTITVTKTADGWISAPDYWGRDWGLSWPLSNTHPALPSRDEAIRESAAVLAYYLERATPSPLHRRGLVEVGKLLGGP